MLRYRIPQCIVVLAFIIAALGCNKKAPPTGDPPPMPAMLNQGPPITEAEAKKFGEDLEEALVNKDVAKAETLIRTGDLSERCVADLNLDADFLRGFRKGATKRDLSTQIVQQLGKGGEYKFLHLKNIDGRFRPVFRMVIPDSGMNYHEFLLARFPDGKIAVEDVYIATSGEEFSRSLRRMILPELRHQNRSALEKLVSTDRAYLDYFNKIQSMFQALRTKTNLAGALADFRSLPAELRNQKFVQIIAVQIAAKLDEAEYIKEMERFRDNYLNDPACELVCIDYYYLKKEYAKANESIDKLAAWVGGDPYLTVLKGTMFIECGKYAEARKEIETAWKLDPKLPLAYIANITLACKENNFKDVSHWMKASREGVGIEYDPAILEKEEDYTEFIKSPEFTEYKTWWKDRK